MYNYPFSFEINSIYSALGLQLMIIVIVVNLFIISQSIN